MNRREFLELSLQSAAAASLTDCTLGSERAGGPVVASAGMRPLSELDAFNYAVSTQTFDARVWFHRQVAPAGNG